ncbi:C-terminal binding protein [Conexibacter woesei]|uniref:D-isomer specific 2-hydroxyacid dehydrogenase NAD-binding protein n=1 Tax=Conexibacter woesei (strain DSM 14684 / CCUG 47730 / CIP 108061 / JCM 11494 / NBRC 100937 / ID131577) TaxID=469383 RepID=D3F4X6_CONWI|nr:C-terminal binding protein [Conexibacter woesei]ADB48554.1 D-isomer specific 2-hydroxyacid dehydrogenase NAD-binding protein [Conexibacter woesei DSM 14684]
MTPSDLRPRGVVVVTDSDLPTEGVAERVLEAAGWTVRRAACRTADDVREAAAGAVALIVQWAPVDASVLANLPDCRFVSRLGIGYDMIDVAAATEAGIPVANVPDYCVEEVAAHTLAFVFSLTRRLPQLDAGLRAGRWAASDDGDGARRPQGTTVAVLGHGRIGARVAQQAASVGFDVLVHDPHVPAERVEAAGHVAVTLDEALERADVVSLHVPLTPQTRHLLDAPALARMRPGSALVNTCRGGLVDETALADALRSGQLGAAALDVFESEPLPADSPLRDAPNLLLSPHAAWYSPIALLELEERAAQQVADFLDGRPVPTIVNPGYARVRADGAPV